MLWLIRQGAGISHRMSSCGAASCAAQRGGLRVSAGLWKCSGSAVMPSNRRAKHFPLWRGSALNCRAFSVAPGGASSVGACFGAGWEDVRTTGAWKLARRIGRVSPHLYLGVHPTLCSDFESLLKHRRDLSSLHPREVFRAVGVSFEDRQALIVQLLPQTPLLLAHEPANPVDPGAVAIHLLYGARLGYVPQAQTHSFRAARPAVLGTVQSVGATSGGRWGFSVLVQPRVPAVLLSALPEEVEETLESGVGAAMEKLEGSEAFRSHSRQSTLSGLPTSPLVRDELATQPARCQLTGAGGARLRAMWELHPAQEVIRLTGARWVHPELGRALGKGVRDAELAARLASLNAWKNTDAQLYLRWVGLQRLAAKNVAWTIDCDWLQQWGVEAPRT